MRLTTIFAISLASLLCIIMPQQTPAETATQAEMELICRNWLSYMVYQRETWAGKTRPEIVDVHEITEGDTLLALCFSISPCGFVVVPILKELPPIKAYSQEHMLDVNQRVGFPQLLREVLLHRIRLYAKIYGSLNVAQPPVGDVLLGREHRMRWDQFLRSEQEFETALAQGKFSSLTQAGPLLSTSWHQGSPYNDSCPMGDGGRCVVGCVATAAAQILKYWNWPRCGTGSYSYTWNGDQSCGGNVGGETLSATFSDEYDWQNMPDSCDSGCASGDSAALAELCYEVGVAFQMDYGACGSGAWTAMALTVFPVFFRYSSFIDKENRSNHMASQWFSIIQTEINSGRPMQYRIHGHSIVCDGWRYGTGQSEYHLNYGWGGPHTAWFTIDNIYCPWPGCDPLVEYMIRYIMPEPPALIRGDANADSAISLGDAIYVLRYISLPGSPAPPCMDAADYDDDGSIGVSDATSTLRYLYVPGAPDPPAPFPNCGQDPTPDELGCQLHPCTPGKYTGNVEMEPAR